MIFLYMLWTRWFIEGLVYGGVQNNNFIHAHYPVWCWYWSALQLPRVKEQEIMAINIYMTIIAQLNFPNPINATQWTNQKEIDDCIVIERIQKPTEHHSSSCSCRTIKNLKIISGHDIYWDILHAYSRRPYKLLTEGSLLISSWSPATRSSARGKIRGVVGSNVV